MEDAVLQSPARQLGEEAFDGIEPRARGWREVEGPAGMAGEPFLDLVLLMRSVVVENDVDRFVFRHLALDTVEEADELLMAMALHVLPDDCSVKHVERCEQRGCAMPLVIVGHGARTALLHRQAGLGAVERLDLRLLVDGQDHRMSRRINIEADDLGELFGENRIVRQFEAAPSMRCKAMRLPNLLHRRDGQPDDLGHRTCRPVGCFVRRRFLRQPDNLRRALPRHRRLARWTGLVAKQAIDAFVHKALLPTPHAGLRLARRGHDRRGAQALAAQQHDTGSPDMLLRTEGSQYNVAQTLTVGGGNGETDTIAHPFRFARQQAVGNLQSDSFVPANPLV